MSKKKTYNSLHAVVAPKKKKVKIMFGKKVLKVYNFKMDVPSKIVEKEFHGHDYSEWCVSERDFTYTMDVVEWDAETISKIETDSLEYFKKTNPSSGYVKGGDNAD